MSVGTFSNAHFFSAFMSTVWLIFDVKLEMTCSNRKLEWYKSQVENKDGN